MRLRTKIAGLLRRLTVVFVIIGVAQACLVGFEYFFWPELTGLKLVSSAKFSESSGEGPGEFYDRHREEWSHSAGKSSREVYRFLYQRSWKPTICVSAWQDGERYWIRSSVQDAGGDPLTYRQWERTRALPAERWHQIRAMFSKQSVIDPLNGKEEGFGWDGSNWILQSVVNGRTTRVAIWCPIDTEDRGAVKARPGFADFVDAGRFMLKSGKVTVWEMY